MMDALTNDIVQYCKHLDDRTSLDVAFSSKLIEVYCNAESYRDAKEQIFEIILVGVISCEVEVYRKAALFVSTRSKTNEGLFLQKERERIRQRLSRYFIKIGKLCYGETFAENTTPSKKPAKRKSSSGGRPKGFNTRCIEFADEMFRSYLD